MNDKQREDYAYEAINKLIRELPEHAYKNQLWDTHNAVQAMEQIIDEAIHHGWNMRPKRLIGTCAMIFCGHTVLMGWHSERKHWEFPGGAQEGNETILQAIQREVEEETGLDDLKNWTNVGWLDVQDGWLDMVFSARLAEFVTVPATKDGKHREWQWFPLERLPQPLYEVADKIVDLGLFDEAWRLTSD